MINSTSASQLLRFEEPRNERTIQFCFGLYPTKPYASVKLSCSVATALVFAKKGKKGRRQQKVQVNHHPLFTKSVQQSHNEREKRSYLKSGSEQ